MRLSQQFERLVEDRLAGVEVGARPFQRRRDLGLLGPDAIEPAAQFGLGPLLLGSQVEEVALFFVEFGQLGGVAFAQLVGQLTVSADGPVNASPHLRQPFGRHGDRRGVVGFHGGLSDFHGDAGQVTHAVLSPPAGKVIVIPAVTALDVRDHQPVLTSLAPQETLEVVVVRPVSYLGVGVLGEQLLYLLEQL
ncbi:hypothetical protein VA596_04405 [Amycolatopsis sp., V23-08]|uniref:Uncharacterized protein n=1 Tax=Amycolatopsis heterodermiae TaxID=3110235 RepID=A0ABU5QXV9_9PSEU|nr:hypothetical protein [Amycolatopsis sp., V23-08]MEA5358767.1 hypothetical protein [Amycolatopsis sp., V23-08]